MSNDHPAPSGQLPVPPGQQPLPLARLTTSLRVTVTVAYVLIVAIWSAGLVVTLMIGHPIGALVAVYAAAITLCALTAAWQIIWVFRTAAWLEGSTLALRGAFTVKRCDLATSRVWLNNTMRGFPRLNAKDQQTRRRIRLPLGRPYQKSIRTPPKLTALAGAIMASGRQDPEAMRVAASLHGWSAPPAGYPPARYPPPDPYRTGNR
jgi:hypothetical protein